MKIKDVFLCWDFIFALIISMMLYIFMPRYIEMRSIKDILSIIVSTLSIIFSLFFAGMSIILTSNDDDFIDFLEKDGIYSGIIDTFKFTLIITFISLIIHIIMYFIIDLIIYDLYNNLNKLFILLPSLIFFYSIFTVFNSVIDSIRYSEKRIKYIKLKNKFK